MNDRDKKYDWVLGHQKRHGQAWASVSKREQACICFSLSLLLYHTFDTSRLTIFFYSCENFRDGAEEYDIPDSLENQSDLLQPVKQPIYNEPIYNEPGVHVVELNREPDSGLGISIIGGKAGPQGQGLKGIFIRHVLESSPAARLGTLVTGDQILEVRVFQFVFQILLLT